jgi:hypothetical protein
MQFESSFLLSPTLLVGPGSVDLASSVLARHSVGEIPKPTKSLLRRGFLNPLSPVATGLNKEASGMASPPPVPTARVLVLWILGRLRVGFLGWRFRRAS